jgi:hypothetical protein
MFGDHRLAGPTLTRNDHTLALLLGMKFKKWFEYIVGIFLIQGFMKL